MTIIKDSVYWKDYNQKRRAYLTEKERQRRQKLKGVYNQEIKLEHVQPEHVQPTFSERVQPCTTILSTTEHVQPNNTTKEKVVDKINNSVVDIQAFNERSTLNFDKFNEEVFKRAGTSEETRFYTFSDGRKIVRTMCGCNPTKDFYDWCLDSCEYFTYWRNKQIKTNG